MKFISALSLILLSLNLFAQKSAPVKTVDHVDLDRYLGTWYEVASIPQSFQKDCERNTTAEYYQIDSGDIQVINSCETSSGKRKIAEGRAKVTDSHTNAKLKVTFVHILAWIYLFGGDYWIIDLADDYSYAVVGDPERKYAWILSRSPRISPINLSQASQALCAKGYDTCEVLTSIQKDGFTERRPICELMQQKK